MTTQVVVGVDGSEESGAAVCWAARDAALRGIPLRIVHVEEPADPSQTPEPYLREAADRAERLLREGTKLAREEASGLEVSGEQLHGRVAEWLTSAADESDLMVLGSRGLGGVRGFVAGSTSLAVVSQARRPVVLVRASGRRGAADAVVVGVDVREACEPLLAFSFTEAARRELPLRFLHTWTLPLSDGHAAIVDPGIGEELGGHLRTRLDTALVPWRQQYPDVKVMSAAIVGSAAHQLVEASQDAGLVVVGRRDRTVPVGPHLGHVAHAVIHHSPAPVAVVPLA